MSGHGFIGRDITGFPLPVLVSNLKPVIDMYLPTYLSNPLTIPTTKNPFAK